jgi:SpoVK/Ycf46/Vps4 family AAA+-type ATPase
VIYTPSTENFSGVLVQGSIIHRLDPELTRRLKFLIEFKLPEPSVRARMWRKMLPEKVVFY